ncbi:MAG: hypothetical protein WCB27_21195 [Thermoguttaceae bacterium]
MRRSLILLTAMLALLAGGAADTPQAVVRPIPSLSELRQVVLRYFRAQRDYRPGDLITRDKIEPLLAQLRRTILPLPDAKQILQKVPAKDEFLAEQFRTPGGRKFMRQIARYDDGYDRLDRLSRLPHGKQTIIDLIRGPDGYKMLEYMTTTPGGLALGDQLSNAPKGKNFNEATGRIYTAEMLLKRLEQSRAATLKNAKPTGYAGSTSR